MVVHPSFVKHERYPPVLVRTAAGAAAGAGAGAGTGEGDTGDVLPHPTVITATAMAIARATSFHRLTIPMASRRHCNTSTAEAESTMWMLCAVRGGNGCGRTVAPWLIKPRFCEGQQ